MSIKKQDETYSASYWKVFPMTKLNQTEVCLFKDDVAKVRNNALKRVIVNIDYSIMEYDKDLSLSDAVSKFTYDQLKISRMSVKPDNYDEEILGEFVSKELNWFVDAEDII